MITYATAKAYLDLGFPVFPVNIWWDSSEQKFKKVPTLDSWDEYQTRLPFPEELEDWFTVHQHNGIGMATGKLCGYIIVDVDTGADPATYAHLKTPLVAESISGGKHFYYRWNGEFRNKVNMNGSKIDIRGDGGYIVLPPSGTNNAQYRWISKADPEKIPLFSEELLKPILVSKNTRETVSDTFHATSNVSDVYAPAKEGERNSRASQVAGSLVSLIPKKLWEVAGWPALREWNNKNEKPLSEKELRTTWESIAKTEGKNNPSPIVILTGSQAEEAYLDLVRKYGEGLSTGFYELDEYFKFVPTFLYLVSATTHTGKTTLALNWAAKIARKGKKVLFASLEQGVFIVPRVKTILNSDTFPDTLWFLDSTTKPSIAQLIESIENIPKENKPDVIMVDHLHFIKKNGKGGTEDIDDMILDLQEMAKILEVPVVVIAHVKKLNADREPTLDDLRDSSMLSQVPGVVVILYRPKNESKLLGNLGVCFIQKNRLGKLGRLDFELMDSGEFSFKTDNITSLNALEDKSVSNRDWA